MMESNIASEWSDEEHLHFECSDEVVEAAACAGSEKTGSQTLAFC